MFTLILGFLTGLTGVLRDVSRDISNYKVEKLKADSDQEKQRLSVLITEAEARKSVLIAEAGTRINAIMRAVFALNALLYITVLIAWDKVVGKFAGCAGRGPHADHCWLFATDDLNENSWKYVAAVIAFYFIYDIAIGTRLKSLRG